MILPQFLHSPALIMIIFPKSPPDYILTDHALIIHHFIPFLLLPIPILQYPLLMPGPTLNHFPHHSLSHITDPSFGLIQSQAFL
jgi:hypothetical protein